MSWVMQRSSHVKILEEVMSLFSDSLRSKAKSALLYCEDPQINCWMTWNVLLTMEWIHIRSVLWFFLHLSKSTPKGRKDSFKVNKKREIHNKKKRRAPWPPQRQFDRRGKARQILSSAVYLVYCPNSKISGSKLQTLAMSFALCTRTHARSRGDNPTLLDCQKYVKLTNHTKSARG